MSDSRGRYFSPTQYEAAMTDPSTVRSWCFHGCYAQPPVLWQMSPDICVRRDKISLDRLLLPPSIR